MQSPCGGRKPRECAGLKGHGGWSCRAQRMTGTSRSRGRSQTKQGFRAAGRAGLYPESNGKSWKRFRKTTRLYSKSNPRSSSSNVGLRVSVVPVWPGLGTVGLRSPSLVISRQKSLSSQHLMPSGVTNRSENSAFPEVQVPADRGLLAGQGLLHGTLVTENENPARNSGNSVWLPLCSELGGITPSEQIIGMCEFWNKHSCVCFSTQRSRQSSSLARRVQLEPRTLGPAPSWCGEDAPPAGHRVLSSGRICLEAGAGPLGKLAGRPRGAGVAVPGGEASAQKPPGLFPVDRAWSQLAGQCRVVSHGKSVCQPGR